MTTLEQIIVILCLIGLVLFAWFKYEQWRRNMLLRKIHGYQAVKFTLRRFFSRPRWGG